MDFALHHIGLANLFENGHNYITFSFMGMLIVFAGLSLISIYITLLPKILDLLHIQKAGGETTKQQDETGPGAPAEIELFLAIAVALHLDQAGGASHEKITWKRHDDLESAWLTAGRLRGLSLRSHLPDRRG